MEDFGCTLRPGGLGLTKRALDSFAPTPGAKVLDIGCGAGATVRYLRARGLDAMGLDKTLPDNTETWFTTGDAAHLPFAGDSFDWVLLECSLSKMDAPEAALAEAARVLRSGGRLLYTDMYARGTPLAFHGLLGRVERRDALLARAQAAGFALEQFEDEAQALTAYWGQLLFENDAAALAGCLGGDEAALKQARCSYFWAVLRKAAPMPRHKPPRCPMDAWIGRKTGLGGKPDPEALRVWQQGKALETVLAAKEKSPFFKAHLAGFTESDAAEPNWLRRLPFTDAETLVREGARMLCAPMPQVARIRTQFTSGSTGPAKRVWFSEDDIERTVDFFSVGFLPVAAAEQRVGIFLSDDTPGSTASLLAQGLARSGIHSFIHGHVQDARTAAQAAAGADCLVGLPAELFYLCKTAPNLRFSSVLLSADYVPSPLIRALEAQWGCRVFLHYGMTETCYGLAVQCAAKEGQHLRAAEYLVEIIEPATGAVLPCGQEGEIVLTSLQSQALPLVRYRTGDIGSLLPGPCPCGSALPHLGPVRGRAANLAQRVNIHGLDEILYAQPGLLAYTAAWGQDGRLTLTVEGRPLDADHLAAQIGCAVHLRYAPVFGTAGRGKRNLAATGAAT